VEIGAAWPGPLPVERVHLPCLDRSGELLRLHRTDLRRLLHALRSSDEIVAHLPGLDGPLLRAVALASARAVVVPPCLPEDEAWSAGDIVRACLDGSHRLRVGLVASPGGSPLHDPRLRRLGRPTAIGPVPLDPSWIAWLEETGEEEEAVLDRPARVLRLLAASMT
jgi:hypothetical protein